MVLSHKNNILVSFHLVFICFAVFDVLGALEIIKLLIHGRVKTIRYRPVYNAEFFIEWTVLFKACAALLLCDVASGRKDVVVHVEVFVKYHNEWQMSRTFLINLCEGLINENINLLVHLELVLNAVNV